MAGPVLFKDLKCISADTLKVLHGQGFTRATPVQEAAIPLFCANKDVAVDAATGSGKTLAFVIPIAERLRKLDAKPKPNEVLALIISPTRELAVQIHTVAEPFLRGIPGCTLTSLIGGTDVLADMTAVKQGATCLIGTPGRVDDVMKRLASLSYKSFEVLVLDEADRLLEMGFQRQLDAIMARLPRQRRTGLFSATQTEAVEGLVRAGLRNPFRVNVAVTAAGGGAATKQKTPTSLEIRYLVSESDGKLAQLLTFLQQHAAEKVIVYFLTCASVDFLANVLPRLPGGDALPLLALHGNLKQRKRSEILAQFADLSAAALLCTDLAARGLDIPDVHWVVQYDAPQNPANFVHRCGRTARMGRAGRALAFLLPHEDVYTDLLRNRNVPLTEQAAAEADVAAVAAATRRLAETDRDIMEKGTKAFVSYIRGYKEHECKFIFEMGSLDINCLGRMFGLLRLPVMKEVRKNRKGLQEFQQSEVDPETVPYKTAAKEKLRQQALRKAKAEGKDHKSQQAKKQAERARAVTEAAKRAEEKKLPAAKRQLQQRRQEVEDLDEDYKLYRKLKKGKMTDSEFDEQMGIVD